MWKALRVLSKVARLCIANAAVHFEEQAAYVRTLYHDLR